MPTFRRDKLVEICKVILSATGATEREASIVSDSLISADLCGVDSHGLFNLKPYVGLVEQGKIKPGAQNITVRESETTALIDANWGFGHVSCRDAVEVAINKAREHMVGVVGMFRCNHIGRLGAYSEMIVGRDMIGNISANTDIIMAPHGGAKSALGNNPISYGFPAGEEEPIIIDFATTTAAEGKIRLALQKRERIPEGWILDKDGSPSTDPADLYEPPLPPAQVKVVGAQLPMAGHKGFGLALAVDILAGAVTGTGCGREIPHAWANGVLIQVTNIEAFSSREDFKKRVDNLIRDIKSSPTRPGVREILMPGEPEFRTREERLRSGIPVSEITWNNTLALAKKCGVDLDGILRE